MFNFGKKKRYTIGEKIRYFDSLLKDNTLSEKKKNWALLRKKNLAKIKKEIKLGDVFVINDKHLGSPKSKPRLVVVAKSVDNKSVTILPVRKDNKIMSLSQFDNERALSMNNACTIEKNKLYEKRGFKIIKNAYLTPKEKDRLYKKVNNYLK